jgi:hypothetical protein
MSDVTAPVLIVGLGNPGREYRETRHNAGFMLVDRLALRWGAMWRKESKFFAEVASATVAGKRVWLAKPDTFMNLSGESVGPLSRFHRIPPAQILVAVDDADLPLGTLRMRPARSMSGIVSSRGCGSESPGLTRQFATLRDMCCPDSVTTSGRCWTRSWTARRNRWSAGSRMGRPRQ